MAGPFRPSAWQSPYGNAIEIVFAVGGEYLNLIEVHRSSVSIGAIDPNETRTGNGIIGNSEDRNFVGLPTARGMQELLGIESDKLDGDLIARGFQDNTKPAIVQIDIRL
jgi:hypothetical protein